MRSDSGRTLAAFSQRGNRVLLVATIPTGANTTPSAIAVNPTTKKIYS
jgi:hypothetical protein